MNDERKTAYVCAGILLFFGIIILVVVFDGGDIDKVTLTFGLILTSLGGLGIWKPKIGEIIAHWMKNAGDSSSSQTQSQKNTRDSSQNMAGRDIHMHTYYGKSPKRRKKK